MPKRDEGVLVEDILAAIGKIKAYIAGLDFATFASSPMVVDAVVRNLEVIGEAANRISEKRRERGTDIPWREMIGLRNRIIHEYFGVDVSIVWQIASKELDRVDANLRKLL